MKVKDSSKIKYLWLVLWAVILAAFALSVIGMSDDQTELSRSRTEEALRRGAVSIYATEGRYPATLEELCGKCGIAISDDLRVEYDIFADNILPEIQVLLR